MIRPSPFRIVDCFDVPSRPAPQQQRRHRARTAVAIVLFMPAVLAGCARKTVGSGAFGAASRPTASVSPAPTPAPTVTVTVPSTSGPTGNQTTLKPPPVTTVKPPKPSSSTSKPPIIVAVHDYAANLGSPQTYCFWEVTSAGTLVVGALFRITEPAGTGPTAVPVTITDNLGDSRSVTAQQIDVNFPATIGSQAADSGNTFLNRIVDVTVTVKPQGGDDNSADDSASVGVQVPGAGQIPAAQDAPAVIPCIG